MKDLFCFPKVSRQSHNAQRAGLFRASNYLVGFSTKTAPHHSGATLYVFLQDVEANGEEAVQCQVRSRAPHAVLSAMLRRCACLQEDEKDVHSIGAARGTLEGCHRLQDLTIRFRLLS